MITIVPFADHQIGYDCVSHLLQLEAEEKIYIPFIVTTEGNNNGWWPSVKEIIGDKELFYFENLNSDSVKDLAIDYFLLISWKYYMKKEWLSIPQHHIINLHYSLLPKYRGTNPVNWVLIHGEQHTGITYHDVSEQLDEGRIILQSSIEIDVEMTVKKLLQSLDALALEGFKNLMSSILENKLTFQKQEYTEHYNSKQAFNKICQLDMDHLGSLKEHINLLKGLSFSENQLLAYSVSENGEKLYYHLSIRKTD